MTKPRPADLYYVEWMDAEGSTSGWKSLVDATDGELVQCFSVGWVLRETATLLVIVPHMNTTPEYDGEVKIPKVNITKRIKLKIGR